MFLPLIPAVLLSSSLPAQEEKPPAEFEGRIEVTEVLLDALVTDGKGDVVPGLTVDDFAVKEEGRPVELTAVSFYSTRYDEMKTSKEVEEAGTTTAGESASSRYFIFFFHDYSKVSTPQDRLLERQMEAARTALDWVRDEIYPSDWVAVVSYDAGLSFHQDFTQDRGAILHAIERAAMAKQADVLTPTEYKRVRAGTAPSLLRNMPHQLDIHVMTAKIYDAIRILAEGTREIVGRKNLLLFTAGFGDVAGDAMAVSRPDRRYYPAMEQALNDNNVAVYPIDLTPPGVENVQSSLLNELAHDTGAFYHTSFGSFTTPLRRIAEELAGYYVLSYTAQYAAGESGYRRVSVKMKNRKLRVRARKGYLYGNESAELATPFRD